MGISQRKAPCRAVPSGVLAVGRRGRNHVPPGIAVFLSSLLLLLRGCVAASDQVAEEIPATPPPERAQQAPAAAAAEALRGTAPARFKTGVALTPRNFPRHDADDVTEMFEIGKKLGNYAVFIYQWSQPDLLDVAANVVGKAEKYGYTPIVALSPTVLTGARKEYDVPDSVRRRAGRKLSFRDDKVHLPYIETVLGLAKLQPPYLCLATEINFLAFADIEEYVAFAAVFKRLRPEIRKVAPNTKVFVSFQWDYYSIMDRDAPDRIDEHSKLIDIFRPELDLVAFTSYPADHFATPSDIPADYYEGILNHVSRSDEIMIMEIGWPSTGKGSPSEQLAFVRRLPELLRDVKPSIVAWSLLHDVDTSFLGGDLASTGLLSPQGVRKPGFEAFSTLGQQ